MGRRRRSQGQLTNYLRKTCKVDDALPWRCQSILRGIRSIGVYYRAQLGICIAYMLVEVPKTQDDHQTVPYWIEEGFFPIMREEEHGKYRGIQGQFKVPRHLRCVWYMKVGIYQARFQRCRVYAPIHWEGCLYFMLQNGVCLPFPSSPCGASEMSIVKLNRNPIGLRWRSACCEKWFLRIVWIYDRIECCSPTPSSLASWYLTIMTSFS